MPAPTVARTALRSGMARALGARPSPATPAIKTFTAAAERLDTISDPVRLQILWWLAHGDRSVTDLCGLVGMRQQAVTHHLNIMKLRRIIAFRRKGRWNLYYLTDQGREVLEAAKRLF